MAWRREVIFHVWGPTWRIGQLSHSQKFTSSGAPCFYFHLMLRNGSGISRVSVFQPYEAEVENLTFPPTPLTRPHTTHYPKLEIFCTGSYAPLLLLLLLFQKMQNGFWLGNWHSPMAIQSGNVDSAKNQSTLSAMFTSQDWMACSLSSLSSVNTKVSPEVL